MNSLQHASLNTPQTRQNITRSITQDTHHIHIHAIHQTERCSGQRTFTSERQTRTRLSSVSAKVLFPDALLLLFLTALAPLVFVGCLFAQPPISDLSIFHEPGFDSFKSTFAKTSLVCQVNASSSHSVTSASKSSLASSAQTPLTTLYRTTPWHCDMSSCWNRRN